MRLFLAIDLPSRVKQKIEKQLVEIKKLYPQCSWVSSNNYHITVYFFGETSKVERVREKLKNLFFDQDAFHLYSSDVGLFINEKILIYLNFRREKKIEELAYKVIKYFNSEFKNNRKFIPHLTLARCKIPSKQQYFVLKKKLEKVIIDVDFKVNKVILFQSLLGGKKPVYRQVDTFPLQ